MENMNDDSKTVLFNYQQFCALSVEENSHRILGNSPNFKDERHLLKKSKMEISDDGSMFLGEKKLTKTLCDDIDEVEYESRESLTVCSKASILQRRRIASWKKSKMENSDDGSM